MMAGSFLVNNYAKFIRCYSKLEHCKNLLLFQAFSFKQVTVKIL